MSARQMALEVVAVHLIRHSGGVVNGKKSASRRLLLLAEVRGRSRRIQLQPCARSWRAFLLHFNIYILYNNNKVGVKSACILPRINYCSSIIRHVQTRDDAEQINRFFYPYFSQHLGTIVSRFFFYRLGYLYWYYRCYSAVSRSPCVQSFGSCESEIVPPRRGVSSGYSDDMIQRKMVNIRENSIDFSSENTKLLLLTIYCQFINELIVVYNCIQS